MRISQSWLMRGTVSQFGPPFSQQLSNVIDQIFLAERVKHIVAGQYVAVQNARGAQSAIDLRCTLAQSVSQTANTIGDEIQVF